MKEVTEVTEAGVVLPQKYTVTDEYEHDIDISKPCVYYETRVRNDRHHCETLQELFDFMAEAGYKVSIDMSNKRTDVEGVYEPRILINFTHKPYYVDEDNPRLEDISYSKGMSDTDFISEDAHVLYVEKQHKFGEK